MGIIQRLFGRADPLPHVTIRHVVATRQESAQARAARVYTELQLAVAIAHLSPEERKAAVEHGKTRIRRARDERGGE
jgi:hypothetical protein